jgi:hypothetical protein
MGPVRELDQLCFMIVRAESGKHVNTRTYAWADESTCMQHIFIKHDSNHDTAINGPQQIPQHADLGLAQISARNTTALTVTLANLIVKLRISE